MKFEIYCDESCLDVVFNRNAHKYMGIGSSWIPSEKRNELKVSIHNIKERFSVFGELKWNKVSPVYFDLYKSLIDYFWHCDYIRYRIILVESNKIDLVKFHQHDGELSFYKFYYQLLQHWIFDFNEYDVYLDDKINKNKARLITLRKVLSNSNLSSKINQVQALPSSQSVGIQITDFLTGLVTSKYNNEIEGESKKNLIIHLESLIGHQIRPTTKSEEKFNVFKINLEGGW